MRVGNSFMYFVNVVLIVSPTALLAAAAPPRAGRASPKPLTCARSIERDVLGSSISSPTAASAGFNALGVSLLGQVTRAELGGGNANDVWGYVSPSGREYAIIGLSVGTGFVEVTDPTNPRIVSVVPDASSIWSDMATFGEFAYNVNESGGGVQIIDLRNIDDGVVSLIGSASGGVTTSHNIFVNPASGFAYACDTNLNSPFGGGFIVYDLTNPANPVVVGAWNEPQAHDLFVTSYDVCPYAGRAGQPCEIAFAFAGGQGLKIVDVTDKSNMTTISRHTYTNLSFCHQGWPSEDRRYMFFGDEVDEIRFGVPTTTYIVDIQDLGNPIGLPSFGNGLRGIDHNMMVRDHFLFEANYVNGLRIFDFSDINDVREVGFFDTSLFGDSVTFGGAWGVYSALPSGVVLISDEQQGLFVLDVIEATGCSDDASCNDGNACTMDVCNAEATCVRTPLAAGVACDDGLICMIDTACDGAGNCVGVDINSMPCVDDSDCGPGLCDLGTSLCSCFECEPAPQPIVFADMVAANRFFSFAPASFGQLAALRVTLADMPPPFEAFEGTQLWVGEPFPVSEIPGKDDSTSPTFLAAPLVCAPVVRDWGSVGPLSVFGAAVVPGGQYAVQAVSRSCLNSNQPLFSSATVVPTSRWGDVVGNCAQTPCTPPDGLVGVATDVVSLLDKFAARVGAVSKTRADLEPGILDFKITIVDVTSALDAFSGQAFPFPGPAPCP